MINIGTGAGHTVGDLAKTILSLMNSSKPIIVDENRVRPGESEVFTLVCDSTKARSLVGWDPKVTLEEGLLQTIEFISRHIHLYKPEFYTL